MSLFLSRLNKTITVTGVTQSGEDGGGQPIYTEVSKGTVRGRIDPRVRPDEVNDANLNPVISEYKAITALPDGFEITESDTMTDATGAYEVLGVHTLDGRSASHHLEINLRRIT
jgi:hypothetical protein